MIDRFKENENVGMILTTKSKHSAYITSIDNNNQITEITSFRKLKQIWISAGYFIFRQSIFNHIDPSDDLPEKTFPSLIEKGLLGAYPYEGTFLTMNTFRDKEALDKMYASGTTPWQVWENKDSKVV
jgi:glucose-1-phosphate cytidylyltransferase